MDKRRFKRKTIVLEAELVCKNKSYVVFVGNISKEGLFVITASLNEPVEFTPGTMIEINTELSSDINVNLFYKIKWSEKIHKQGLVWKIGMEIIKPPPEYYEYIKKEGLDEPVQESFIISDNKNLNASED